MDRCNAALRPVLSAAAIVLVMGWATISPTFADDIGANKSELIQGLLPTVVNISVRKAETATPPAVNAGADATTPSTSAPPPATDATPTIKSYVGSGFVIDPSGLVVTNYHVVEDAFEVTVTFSDGSRLPGKMLSASRLADLALVKVDSDHPLAAAHWGNSDKLQVGDQVFAAGNPFGIGLSVSAGIVSGLNRDIQNSPYDDLIQTDATINHGNSGGPLFDMQGDVIGVNSTIISPTSGSAGIGFAIPSASARFVIDQLHTYGWVRPGWIGVKVQTVTREIADAIGMPRPEGSIVAWVLPNGPAKKADLSIGDIILRYGGTAPSDERALLRDIAHTSPGTTVPLVVRHGGAERTVPISVEAWPRDQWDARDAPVLVQRPKLTIPPDLGLTLSGIAPDQKAKFGLEGGVDGVLVKDVIPDSDPAHRGMVSGDVILRVQDRPVATPEEVQSGINAARAAKHDYILMLVLPKVRVVQGPKWVPLQLTTAGG
ncbi:MAG TPA: trypsin-like peptidase domain-containing protein [Rhodopila sp.]